MIEELNSLNTGRTKLGNCTYFAAIHKSLRWLLLVTRPLPRDGGMAEDHGSPEAGQLPRVLTSGRRETESRQRVSGAESVAGQCRMR